MKDYTQEIRNYIYQQLNGNITLNAANVPILNKTSYPYIEVEPTSSVNRNTKTNYGKETAVNVIINTRFKNQLGRYDDCENISNQVFQILGVRGQSINLGGDYTAVIVKFTQENYLLEYDENFDYYTKVIGLSFTYYED